MNNKQREKEKKIRKRQKLGETEKKINIKKKRNRKRKIKETGREKDEKKKKKGKKANLITQSSQRKNTETEQIIFVSDVIAWPCWDFFECHASVCLRNILSG